MSSTPVTRTDVVGAAVRVLASGQYPSADRVRAALGDRGSKSTIQKHLADWREELGEMNVELLPPSLPPALIQPLEALYGIAVDEASKRYAEAKNQLEHKVENAQALVAAKDKAIEEAERRIEACEREIEARDLRINDLQGRVDEHREATEQARMEAREQLREAEARHERALREAVGPLEKQLLDMREQARDVQGELERERHEHVRTQTYFEGQEEHYVKMAVEARDQLKASQENASKRQKMLENELALVRQKLTRAQDAVSERERQLGNAEGQLQGIQGEVKSLRESISRSEREAQRLSEQYEERLTTLAAERDTERRVLAERLEALVSRVQLKGEDRALLLSAIAKA